MRAGSIPQSANALDLDGHRLIRQQPSLRIPAKTNSRRSSGTDDIPGLQWDDARNMCNQVWDLEDQIACICRLHNFVVQSKTDVQLVRILDVVSRDDPWPYRRKGRKTLSKCPLRGRKLDFTCTHIIHNRVTEDVLAPVLFRDPITRLSDDDSELRFQRLCRITPKDTSNRAPGWRNTGAGILSARSSRQSLSRQHARDISARCQSYEAAAGWEPIESPHSAEVPRLEATQRRTRCRLERHHGHLPGTCESYLRKALHHRSSHCHANRNNLHLDSSLHISPSGNLYRPNDSGRISML